VAVGDTVYVTLGAAAPVTALDAATGKEKRVYAETAGADEILCTGSRLIVSINPVRQSLGEVPAKSVCAVDTTSGKMLWRKGPFTAIRSTKGQDPFGRLELAAGDGKVVLLTTKAMECLQVESGKTLWRIERPGLPDDAVTRIGFAGVYEYLLSVLVYHDGVVLLAQPEPNTHHTYHTMPGSLYAFDARGAAKRRRRDAESIWEQHLGIRVTAMVRAADTIFVAGSPDVVDLRDPHGAWQGRKGGRLAAFAAADGKKLAEYKLSAPPVWDGMAAVDGRLYLSQQDGSIVSMTGDP